jgi:RecB family exonuclease
VERVVGRQAFENEMDGRVIGDLIHAVLSGCYRSLARDGSLPLTSETLPEAQTRAEQMIAVLVRGPDCPGTPGERRVVECRLNTMVRRLLEMEVAAGGSLVFTEAEVEVGGEDGVDIGGLRVRGRLDRIDRAVDDGSQFVLDYKSGSAPSLSDIGTAKGLQLPLYLLALAAERREPGTVGGAYISLVDGVLSGVVSAGHEDMLGERPGRVKPMAGADWQELNDTTLSMAKTAADGMRQGQIAPRPDRDCPAWCELGPVCRAKRGGRR